MRIIFMGTPEFSVPVLKDLINSRHEVVCAVTQPDKPKGRGKAMQCSPVKEAALAAGIEVLQPERLRAPENVEKLASYRPDMIVVVAYGQILSKKILELPPYGCINVHASLLPAYRGSAPIQWVILNGEKETGVTTMYMSRGIDTGDMLLKKAIPIEPEDNCDTLSDKLSVLGGPLLLETIQQLEGGKAVRIPQDESQSSYVPMIEKEMGHIDWNESAQVIERKVRGLYSWPGVYTRINGKKLKIWKSKAVAGVDGARPGEVIDNSRGHFIIQTGDGALLLMSVQPEGKKCMDADAYLRGYPIELHEVIGG